MMGGPGGQMDPAQMAAMQGGQPGQKKPKPGLPNLISDNNGKNKMALAVNKMYHLFYIVRNFANKGLFFSGWIGVLFIFPMAFCYTEEQQRIMMKI